MKLNSMMTALALLAASSTAMAQEGLSDAEKREAMETLERLIDENYVYPERGIEISDAMAALFASGRYDDIDDHRSFAAALTEDLVDVSDDHHFLVVYNPGLISDWRARRAEREEASEATEGAEETPAETPLVTDWNRWYGEHFNFGFQKIEILPGNVGYVKLDFFQPIDWLKTTLDSSMSFVAHTDALILDLSDNGGGYSPSDAYLASYFFEDGPRLWSEDYNRPEDETSQTYTFETVGSDRYLDRPVFILVGENTFSLGESLAYGLQGFDQAIIVGQTTTGAAHAIDVPELNDNFFVQLPVIRSIHPVTQTDWEGTGVVPDIVAPVGESRRVAHLAALDHLIENAPLERIRNVYQEARDTVDPQPSEPQE